jgi:predicted nucleotidyltransferase
LGKLRASSGLGCRTSDAQPRLVKPPWHCHSKTEVTVCDLWIDTADIQAFPDDWLIGASIVIFEGGEAVDTKNLNGTDQIADLGVRRIMRTIDEIRDVIRAHQDELRSRYKARVVGIFGSYARGEQQADSDLDVLAAFDSGASLLDLGGAQVMLSELLSLKVDLIPREDVRPELKETIESEAVPV